MKQLFKSTLLIVLIVVAYKCMLQFVVPYLGYWLYTLILLITPVVLFMMVSRLQSTTWKQQLPFLSVLFCCLSVSISAGLCIGMVDYIVLKYRLTLFGTDVMEELQTSFAAFMWSYVSWYAVIGVVSGVVVWCVLYLKKSKQKKKVGKEESR
ncbi:MAG: hypothetical protein V4590_11815 [Bacteroidota bacterium]